ncbi:MAG: DUF4199 domain-containing protein [Pseudomonadota bacterium]
MQKYIIKFGLISGAAVVLSIIVEMGFVEGAGSEFFGYTAMFIALSSIFVAIKRYRDFELGGVIRFWPAMGLGLGISAVAGLAYVGIWEVYLALTDYAFIEQYVEGALASAKERGDSPEDYATLVGELESMAENYAKPWFRLPITFIEIFPVGVLVSIFSAALLRRSEVLNAQA